MFSKHAAERLAGRAILFLLRLEFRRMDWLSGRRTEPILE
jgi:hypothetical protein